MTLGIVFYIKTNFVSKTALIPFFMGIPMCIMGYLMNKKIVFLIILIKGSDFKCSFNSFDFFDWKFNWNNKGC